MQPRWTFAVGIILAATSTAPAQVTSAVMSVTQTHMS
jgi:hypothetical protein